MIKIYTYTHMDILKIDEGDTFDVGMKVNFIAVRAQIDFFYGLVNDAVVFQKSHF